MLLVSNEFGGLSNRRGANLIGPNLAADLSNVKLDDHGISALLGPGAMITSAAGTIRSAYKFNGTWILSTEARQYLETAGMLIYAVTGQHPKKTTDGTTFHNLGIQAPQAACTAAAGAAGALTGDFTYYVTFYSSVSVNGVTQESGPSVGATVTLAAQRGSLSAIPTHLGTGDIASGTNTILNVTDIGAWQVGMRLIGQIAAGTSAPDASVGIPAGATVTAIDTGTNTLTISANATATAAGIRLTDPQFAGRKIYRSGTGQSTTGLVTTIADMTTLTYTDNTAVASVGAPIDTVGYLIPGKFDAIAVSPQGVLLGAVGRSIQPSEPALPWAFTVTEYQANETVKALAHYAGAFVILTVASCYVLDGTSARNFVLSNTPSQQGCAERDTVIDMGDALFYLSPDGVTAFDGRIAVVISKEHVSDAFMAAISATNAKAVRYNERYYLFHSTGFLVWDNRQPGSPWNKGDLGANEATAAHYSRLDDAMFVVVPNAGSGEVRQWEAGAALTWSYRTGDWHGDVEGLEDFYRRGRLVHSGAVTLTCYVDATAGTAKANTRSAQGPFDFWVSKRGLRLALLMGGTGSINAIYAELGRESRRA